MKFVSAAVIAFGLVIFSVSANALENLAADQVIFQSITAQNARSSGSPVGPPAKVTLCHNGKTITVAESAVSAHLAHGDTLGPCPGGSNPTRGNNGLGNGLDPQPPGNPPVNDGPGTSPGNPGVRS